MSFVAVDGEALGQGNDARYCLLAASTGRFIFNIDGIGTTQAFDFLINQQSKGVELVCFGLGYDVNQWLRDLPETSLRELWKTGVCIYKHYRLVWTPGRRFEIYNRRTKRFAIIQECFGFFQSSFVKALQAWGFEVPAELAEMKLTRGRFTDAMKKRVIDYCFTECDLLVSLMDKLAVAAKEANCTPKSHWWIGAGQLASAMLAHNGVAAHHSHDVDIAPVDAIEPLMCAYFGGRAELLRQGERSQVNTYDLRSAYPWAATHLSSLQGASLIRRSRFNPTYEHAIWRVNWSDLPGNIMPFPVRCDKAIWYPRSGSGWYHACEVKAALACGFDINVSYGYSLRVRKKSKPFGFVPEMFQTRRQYQLAGHPAEKVIKLALNSLYGKTAQGVSGTGKPRWQSYMWAGEITARTRARMLELAVKAQDPMMIATDGLFCGKAPAKPTKAIGGWEHGTLDWLFVAQPGVYQGFSQSRVTDDNPAGELLKSRGFFVKDIDYEELHDGWKREGPDYVYTYRSNRFIGLGQVINRREGSGLGQWREWVDQDRSIYLRPQRKNLMRDDRNGGYRCTPVDKAPGESEPYHPKMRLDDSKDEDNQAGLEQPLRETV